MAEFVLIRHGEPDYSECDRRGLFEEGRDLAPLTERGRQQANETALDERLYGATLILASPFTRAIETAAILNREHALPIRVLFDLYEWRPDTTYTARTDEEYDAIELDFNRHMGEWPAGETRCWETISSVKKRVRKALEPFVNEEKVLIVCHGMVMRALSYTDVIPHCGIICMHSDDLYTDQPWNFYMQPLPEKKV